MERYLYYGSLGPHERQYRVANVIGLTPNPAHDRELAHDAGTALPLGDASIAKIRSQDVVEHIAFGKSMFVQRALRHDRRAGGAPVSLVVDFIK